MNALKNELSVVHTIITKDFPKDPNKAVQVSEENFPFITASYDSCLAELPYFVKPPTLITLHRAYNHVTDLNKPSKITHGRGWYHHTGSVFLYYQETISDVSKKIEEAINKLKKELGVKKHILKHKSEIEKQ